MHMNHIIVVQARDDKNNGWSKGKVKHKKYDNMLLARSANYLAISLAT
jgi:hypothetical protein